MKTKHKVVLLAAALATLATLPACSTCSLNPLAGPNDPQITYDPALEGKWKTQDGDCFLVISGDGKQREYGMQYVAPPEHKDACQDEHDKPGVDDAGPFFAKLIQLGTGRFLDVVPSFEPRESLASWGYIGAHTILKVQIDGDQLFLDSPNSDWLCKTPDAQRRGQCSYSIGANDFIFTAPTEAVQDFLKANANNEELFAKPTPDGAAQRVGEASEMPKLSPNSVDEGWGGYSLNSLAEWRDPQVVYDAALEGLWKHPDRDDYCLLDISGSPKDRSYNLKYVEPPQYQDTCGGKWAEHGVNESGPFEAVLVQLGSYRFLDITPVEEAAVLGGDATLGYFPVHSIVRVDVSRKTLWLTEADDLCQNTPAKARATALKQTVGTCVISDHISGMPTMRTVIYTAPTKILQDLIRTHASDGIAFSKEDHGDFRLRVGKSAVSK